MPYIVGLRSGVERIFFVSELDDRSPFDIAEDLFGGELVLFVEECD